MSLRIAIVTSTFPPYRGGMGRVAETDARQFAALGHEVHVYTSQRGAAKAALDRLGQEKGSASPAPQSLGAGESLSRGQLPYRVHHLPVFLRLPGANNGYFVPTAAFLARRYDLVVLHYPFYGAAEPMWLARLLSRRGKLVVTYHMDALGAGWLRPFIAAHARFVMPRILLAADRVLVTTLDYAQNGNLKRLLDTHETLFQEQHLAVDVKRFSPGPRDPGLLARYGLSADDRLVVFCGGLDRPHYFKGLPNLLLAMTAPELEGAKLLVVGDGPLKGDFEEQAKGLGLAGRVVFAGNVSEEELADHHRLASVFAFPSLDKSEAFGIAALEAMACGAPVVASDLAGVRTIVREGETGRRVPPGSASALAVALAEILADEPVRAAMGAAARRMAVSEYSEEARLARWREILEGLYPDWKHFS